MDHIHVINQVIKKSAEYNKPVYMALMDYEKKFDSGEISAFIEVSRNQGVQEAYVNILGNIYKDSTDTLVLPQKKRGKKAVRQGDTISPMHA